MCVESVSVSADMGCDVGIWYVQLHGLNLLCWLRLGVLVCVACDQSWTQRYRCRGRGGDRGWSAWRAVADVAGVRDAGVGDVYDEERTGGVV